MKKLIDAGSCKISGIRIYVEGKHISVKNFWEAMVVPSHMAFQVKKVDRCIETKLLKESQFRNLLHVKSC